MGQFPYKLFVFEVPFFVNMRGNLFSQKERKCVPFWNVDIGYLIVRKFMFDVGIGVRAGGIRNNFVLSVNYIGRMVEPHYNQESKFSNGILMKLGYEFKKKGLIIVQTLFRWTICFVNCILPSRITSK